MLVALGFVQCRQSYDRIRFYRYGVVAFGVGPNAVPSFHIIFIKCAVAGRHGLPYVQDIIVRIYFHIFYRHGIVHLVFTIIYDNSGKVVF